MQFRIVLVLILLALLCNSASGQTISGELSDNAVKLFDQAYDKTIKLIASAWFDKSDVLNKHEDANRTLIYNEGESVIAVNGKGVKIASGTSGTDDATVIQAAIDDASSGDTIVFMGSFLVPTTINLDKSLTLDGNGSTLAYMGSSGSTMLRSEGVLIKTTTLAIDAIQYSNEIAIANTSGIEVGDLALVYDNVEWGPNYYPGWKTGELHEVVSIVPNTKITVNDHLLHRYDTIDSAKLEIYRSIALTLKNINLIGKGRTYNQAAIDFEYHKNTRILNCRMSGFDNAAIQLYDCYNSLVFGNDIRDSLEDGIGYGVSIWNSAANTIIKDNYIANCRHCITSNGASHYGVTRNISIIGNTLINGSNSVIDAHPAAESMYISNNIIESNGEPAVNSGAKITIVNDNLIHGMGIGFREEMTDVVFRVLNNTIINGGEDTYLFNIGDSISTSTFEEIDIRNNTVSTNGSVGIELIPDITIEKLYIIGNRIVLGGSDGCNKTGIHIKHLKGVGEISSNSFEITCAHGIACGIRIEDSPGALKIKDNTISGSPTTYKVNETLI